MHIKNAQSALLSNHELLIHLRAEEAEYAGTDGTYRARPKPKGLKDVLEDTISYLSPSPMPLSDETEQQEDALAAAAAAAAAAAGPAQHLDTLIETHPERPMTLYKGPHSLFRVLAPDYRLNKAEYLQIYNLRPRTVLELDLVIEESSIRFEEHELDDILARINQVLDEEEESIPVGVENQDMSKIANKLLGAAKKKRASARRKV
ncbi:hypothetical protein K504DRAFT_460942 [Pleomassaria siparia CBS 279.74]|uniref:DNA-directed RNA polymerase III subunit RPC9 n=1 Tax=Pleomassaria siparia CBS 279.74 TaxID=1314801 RepID=A0A6G1JWS7_9PLEO|nr:hypothetical protein K504DRAFT_460942 [Pleomassaria siparia CBS 279.74]